MLKLPIVKSDYPDEVNMISFKKIAKWKYPAISGFQYDYINDDLIEKAFLLRLDHIVDLNLDWEDDDLLYHLDIQNNLKHPLRVAALIRLMEKGGSVFPVTIDTFVSDSCCSCVSNGHHRIRALQYLKYTHFPASCSGHTNEIKKITSKRVDKLIIFSND